MNMFLNIIAVSRFESIKHELVHLFDLYSVDWESTSIVLTEGIASYLTKDFESEENKNQLLNFFKNYKLASIIHYFDDYKNIQNLNCNQHSE